MALIRLNLNPSARQLNWFGLIVLAFFGVIGGLVLWQAGSLTAATVLWSIGAAICLLFYAVPRIRMQLYRGWMYAFYPIGWTVSHLVLVAIYFLVLSPIGLTMRLLGRDPIQRRLEEAGRRMEEDPHAGAV